MRKFFRGIWLILEVVIIVYVLGITSLILFRNEFGYTQFGDNTLVTINRDNVGELPDSKYGDLLVINNNYGYKKGDNIYYYVVVNDAYIVRYGEIAKTRGTGSSTLYFVKNNDDTNSVTSSKVIGDSVKKYEGYGKTINFLQGKIAFLFLVLLPIMIVFIYQIYELINLVKYEKVDIDVKVDKKKDDVEEL
jgi:hypothetical protein